MPTSCLRCVGLRTALAVALAAQLCLTVEAQRLPTDASHGIVASASRLASEAGLEILRKGGNAVDASIATGLVLSVTYPRAGNIGGGGFMVIRHVDGLALAIDFREEAPAAAKADMYLDAKGAVIPGRSTHGYLAAGVPGTIAGFALALEKHGSGKVSWAEVVEPARRLAAEGFEATPGLVRDLRGSERLLAAFPESRRVYLQNGAIPKVGDKFVQPDLARTFARMQKDGPREFYEGETARLIAQDMARHGGLITQVDLRAYRAMERAVLRGSYRGYEILTMPPPSSGGIALLQMLAMLEPYDVASLGHNSAAKIHLFAEVMRRAFRDRAEYLGDPDFVFVPTQGLIDPAYARSLMGSFSIDKATPSEGLPAGKPAGLTQVRERRVLDDSGVAESAETTHYSVIDAAGTAVSTTYTLNGLFGNGVTVTDAGFLLNNEMDDFTSKIGEKNMFGLIQGPANAIAPGKRPLSSMTPTIVVKDNKPVLVTGSPGGPTIINTTLLIVTHVIDFGMSLTQAVDAPRFHHQWLPNSIDCEPFLTSRDSQVLLEAKGHVLTSRKLYPNDPEAAARSWGDGETVRVDLKTGRLQGANDLRSPDSAAVGY